MGDVLVLRVYPYFAIILPGLGVAGIEVIVWLRLMESENV